MQQKMVQMQQMLVQMQQMLVQQQLQPAPAPPPQQLLEQMQQMLVRQQLQPVQQPPAKAPPPPAVQQPAPSPAAVLPPPGLPPQHRPHQCTFHSPQASANLPTVDLSGGRHVYDEYDLDNEFQSMFSTLFFDDARGADELHNRLRSDFKKGLVKIMCARTSSGATRWWHTQCLHCQQFNHVEYGRWVCTTPEDKVKARQKLFLWHCPPIQSAPPLAPGAAFPEGKPQV